MATTTIAALLQATFLFLTGVRSGVALNRIPAATAQQAVNLASNAVQIADQAAAPVGFAVVPNDGFWPNMKDLLQAPYRDASGRWVRLGMGGTSDVQLVESVTSFGDLNHDGRDDAAVIVKKNALGTTQYFLAAMLNQGGIMFDIAEMPLGATFSADAASHAIVNGEAALNGKSYRLLGKEWQAL